MLRLHGFDVSNYYNMARFVLLEKQAEFETVLAYPSQKPAYLEISPMGKVPILETEHGHLTETSVIIEYLDETLGEPRFFPDDAFARGQVRELARLIELYIELPARRCYPQAYFGQEVAVPVQKESKAVLLQGIAALRRKARFAPYVAGPTLSAADVVFVFTFDLAQGVAQKVFGFDLFDELPGARNLMDKLESLETTTRIRADTRAAMAEFQKYVAQRYG